MMVLKESLNTVGSSYAHMYTGIEGIDLGSSARELIGLLLLPFLLAQEKAETYLGMTYNYFPVAPLTVHTGQLD